MPRNRSAIQHSAGILLYRRRLGFVEVLLAHPGGPLWRRRRSGWWQLPKGSIQAGEDTLTTARREYAEELGTPCEGQAVPLGEVRQHAGKIVTAFAVEGDFDPARLASNRFSMEWPRGSGRLESFPEVDEVQWFTVDRARAEMLPSQRPLLDRLSRIVRDQEFS